MHISIEHLDPLDRIPIIMDPDDTISSLKGRIMDEFFLPVDEMNNYLLVVDGRDPLDRHQNRFLDDAKDLFEADDSTTLRDLGIKDDDCLRIGYKQPFVIHAIWKINYGIKTGYKITIDDCNDTVQSLMDKICSAMGKPLNRDNFPSILLTELARQRSLLSFGFYNFHPKHWKRHDLYLNPWSIRPEFYGEESFYEAKPDEEEESQRINAICKEEEEKYLNDSKVQIYFEIPYVSHKFPILANLESVSMLKDAIIAQCKSSLKFHFPDYILNGRFELFYGNRWISNFGLHYPTIYGVEKGSLLQLYYDTSFHMEVIFSDRHRRYYSVYVRCFDTVARLKEKVEHVTGLPKKQQYLSYNGRCLDSNKTKLVYYGINGLGDKCYSIPIHLQCLPHLGEEESEDEEEEKRKKKMREEYERIDVELTKELNKGLDSDYFTTTPGIEEEQVDLLAPELVPVHFKPVNEPPQDVDYVAKDSGDTTSPEQRN